MMDTIFQTLMDTGEVVIYMDNILIATPNDLPPSSTTGTSSTQQTTGA